MLQVKVLVVSFKGVLASPSTYLSTTVFMAVTYILSIHQSAQICSVLHCDTSCIGIKY